MSCTIARRVHCGVRRSTIIALLVLAFAPVLSARTDLVRVRLAGRADLDRVVASGADVARVHRVDPDLAGAEIGPAACDVLVRDDRDVARLAALLLPARVVRRDLERHLAARLHPAPLPAGIAGPPGFGAGAMGGYYTLAQIEALLDHYAATYPQCIAPKLAIGTSHQGRPIHALKLSDHPRSAEDEPAVLFDALHHAREPVSALVLLYVLDRLARAYGDGSPAAAAATTEDEELRQLVAAREIWFVPCVNPDGYAFNEVDQPDGGGLWRKNRRNNPGSCEGVDLNRNWPTGYGDDEGSGDGFCDQNYRGPFALSEPETAALNSFLLGRGVTAAWSMHSSGNQLLRPFGWTTTPPANEAVYVEFSAAMVAHNGYVPMPAWELYFASGAAGDHYHQAHGIVAFTPEMADEFWPPVAEVPGIALANLEPALILIRRAGSWLEPLALAVMDDAGDQDGKADPGETIDLVVTVRNQGLRATAGSATVSLGADLPPQLEAVAAPPSTIPPLASRTNGDNAAAPLRVRVVASAAPGTTVAVPLTVSFDGIVIERTLDLAVGSFRVLVRDDVERDLGWSRFAPGDAATGGLWTRGDPVGITYAGVLAQHGDDATPAPGAMCFMTGNGGDEPGEDDVDGGPVTLTTPVFDLSGTVAPRVRYQRFYFNDDGDDPFVVSLSNDGGVNWTTIQTIHAPPQTGATWVVAEFAVAEHLAPTDRMRVRFRAADVPNNSVTEAMIDDLELLDAGTAPRVTAFGRVVQGGSVECQIAGIPGAPVVLFAAAGTGNHALFPVKGTLGLDPASLVFLFAAQLPAAGAGPGGIDAGLLRLPIAVSTDPSIVGATGYLQAIAGQAPSVFSNVATITVEG